MDCCALVTFCTDMTVITDVTGLTHVTDIVSFTISAPSPLCYTLGYGTDYT